MQTVANPQLDTIRGRLPVVTAGLVLFSILLLVALARLQQLSPSVRQEFELRSQNNTQSIRRVPAERGVIYDRDGVPLAFNVLQYEIGVSPNLVLEPERISQELGVILNMDEFEIFNRINQEVVWTQIARPVSADLGQQIEDLDEISITINPLSRRAYPQDTLAAPIIGFVIQGNDNNTRGVMGVESNYNNELAGRAVDQTFSTIPLDTPLDVENQNQRGRDIVLTIDRDIQYWMEYELRQGIFEYQAQRGVIIVMNPRNGEVLAMAQYPSFDPNNFAEETSNSLRNMAIQDTYEPGSVMKVMTVATALEAGIVNRGEWTYNDTGLLEVGGIPIVNWDRQSWGIVDLDRLLINSLNIGAATIALQTGPDIFYAGMQRFGMGEATRIDLPGEESGLMRIPGDSDWNEADFAANSYGQAMSVTPMQMTAAFAAIANDGLLYQPHVMYQIIDGDEVRVAQPIVNRVVSSETANTITDIMVRILEDPVEGTTLARLEGYTIAGKTGTAQIATPLGYEDGFEGQTIGSFIGFFPADDPQVVVYIRLDRSMVNRYGSQTAAPLFRTVAQRLILLLGIPTDAVRLGLEAEGGILNQN
jgi:cell division protein FtsI (penicillin-binding protein 3)